MSDLDDMLRQVDNDRRKATIFSDADLREIKGEAKTIINWAKDEIAKAYKAGEAVDTDLGDEINVTLKAYSDIVGNKVSYIISIAEEKQGDYPFSKSYRYRISTAPSPASDPRLIIGNKRNYLLVEEVKKLAEKENINVTNVTTEVILTSHNGYSIRVNGRINVPLFDDYITDWTPDLIDLGLCPGKENDDMSFHFSYLYKY